MPLKIIDGDTLADLIFTCPADRDLRRVDAPHTHEKIIKLIKSSSDAGIVQKKSYKKIPDVN